MNSSSHLKYGSNEFNRNLSASFQQSPTTSHSHYYSSQQAHQQQHQQQQQQQQSQSQSPRNFSNPVSTQHLQNQLLHHQHQQQIQQLNSILLTSDEIINFPMTDELGKILRLIDYWYTIDCRQLPSYFTAVAQRTNSDKDLNVNILDESRVNIQRNPAFQNKSMHSPTNNTSTSTTTTSSRH